MKDLLEKYKKDTLNDPKEQDEFVHQLLEIRAARAQQKGQVQPPNAVVKTMNPMRMVWFKRVALAASLLLGGFFLWFSSQENGNENSLRADIGNFSKGMAIQVRGEGATSLNELDEKLNSFYENADYQAIIRELSGKSLTKESEILLLGIAYANQKKPNFEKALTNLTQVHSAEYKQNVQILIALCHIGLQQNGAAKDILQQIIFDANYGEEHIAMAKKLLKEIE